MKPTRNRPQSAYNTKGSRLIHDPEKFKQIKYEKSNPYFRDCKVTTCSHILTGIDGRSLAMAFPLEKTGWKNPNSHQNMNKSSEIESLMRSTYQYHPNLHAGMMQKPLERYDPNAFRSRLPVATIVMPHKNSSQIVIGDKSSVYKRHFVTTNQN